MLKIEVSYRAIIVAVLTVAALFALVRLWPVIILLVTAFIFMAALLPYVEWLVHRRVPRTLAVVIVGLTILAVIAGLFALVVPGMVDEFQNIRDNLPENARKLEDFLADFGIHVELENRARDVDWGEVITGRVAIDYGQRALAIGVSIVSIIAITAYLLADAPRLSRFFYQFVPKGGEDEAGRLLNDLKRVVGGYVRGQLITSLAIAFFTLIVLLALRVPNAIAFAVLAGFVDIIPIVGAFIAVIAPTIAAFDVSPTRALITAGLLIAYQQFEDRILVPRVYGTTLNLPPLVVLIAVLVGAELLGIPGVLLALPAAAVIRVGYDYWMERRGRTAELLEAKVEVMAPDDEAPPKPPPTAGEGRTDEPAASRSA